VSGRVMQEVPLPNLSSIPAGAKISGHVVDATRASGASPARLSVQFDTLEARGKKIPVTTNLRAVASFVAVEQAQLPLNGSDRGTPPNAWTTVQIGGDVVYRGGGHVEGVAGRVGEPVADGVLGRLLPNALRGCRAGVDAEQSQQALWVFSSSACGAYGLPHLRIRHFGRTDPIGQIVFDSSHGNINIASGAGILLIVDAASPDNE
jgi:hypothetical protein